MSIVVEGKAAASCQHWRSDLTVVVAALACIGIVGGMGAALLQAACTPGRFIASPDEAVFLEQMQLVYWTNWGARVVGRLTGDLLGGVILGLWLRSVSPWRMFVLIAAYPLIVLGVNSAFWQADEGRWLAAVGPYGAAAQLALQCLMTWLVVAYGIWYGRWWSEWKVMSGK